MECDFEEEDIWSTGKKRYCPDFGDSAYLYGDQYTNR